MLSDVKKGRLVEATIRSKLGAPCKVRYGDKLDEFETEPGETYVLAGAALKRG